MNKLSIGQFINSLKFCAVKVVLENGSEILATACEVKGQTSPYKDGDNKIEVTLLNDEANQIGRRSLFFNDVKSFQIVYINGKFYLDDVVF